jgi:type I restriction enzyme, S subunit
MSKAVEQIQFAQIAEFRNGLNFRKESHGKGCLLVGIPDFKDRFSPDYEFLNEINPEGIVKEEDYLQKGDIVFVRSNGNKALVGRSLYIDKDVKALFSGFCIRARFTTNSVDQKFCAYYTKTESFKSQISSSAGTNINNLNQGILGQVKIPLFSQKDQQIIASVLSALDAKIECNNRINAELEAMAKTLYDHWFVQFDFPDRSGKPYKSSGGRMVYNPTLKRKIPEGWKDGTASNLFNFNPKSLLTINKEASYIDMNSIPLSGFMTTLPDRKVFSGGIKFQNGDVVVARITPCLENGKTALISLLRDNEVGFGSTEFIVMRSKNFPLPAFASQLSRSSSFRQFAITNMTGTSGRKRVDANTLETFLLPLPPEDILLRYENVAGPFFKIMTNSVKENAELTQLRDWLLPMLMNGQVTVA